MNQPRVVSAAARVWLRPVQAQQAADLSGADTSAPAPPLPRLTGTTEASKQAPDASALAPSPEVPSAVQAQALPPASFVTDHSMPRLTPAPNAGQAPRAEPALAEDGEEVEFEPLSGEQTPWPLYPAQLPPQEVRARYAVARTGPGAPGELQGGGRAQALLHWQPGAQGSYRLLSSITQPGGRITQTHSQGEWGQTGLQPQRLLHQRPQGGTLAANFLPHEGQIRFSSQHPALAHTEGVQDRLSWWLQVPAVVQAAAHLQVAGAQVRLRVVGAHGASSAWVFKCLGWDTQTVMGQPRRLLHWRRLPTSAHGTAAELWLDPERGHWPVLVWLKPGRAAAGQLWALTSLEGAPPE